MPHLLGLESGKGACFAHQLGKCQGACCGLEAPERHRLRLQLALQGQRLQVWPHQGAVGLREHNEQTGRTDIHVFDQWCHLATVHDEAELAEALSTRHLLAFDLDTYRLALKHLVAPWAAGTSLLQLGAVNWGSA